MKPRPAHGSLGLEPEIRDHFATSGQRALPASVWDFPMDQKRKTRQGLGMPLGAFRGGSPLERLVAISDKRPQRSFSLLTQVVNDKGRYHSR